MRVETYNPSADRKAHRKMPYPLVDADADVTINILRGVETSIGDHRNRQIMSLHRAVEVVVDRSQHPVEAVFAWGLLLRVDWYEREARELRDEVVRLRDRVGCFMNVQPLMALLAQKFPSIVLSIWPDYVDHQTVLLCGQAGIDAALHELKSSDPSRRESAVQVLLSAQEAGIDFPIEPALWALAKEDDESNQTTRQNLQQLINAAAPVGGDQ